MSARFVWDKFDRVYILEEDESKQIHSLLYDYTHIYYTAVNGWDADGANRQLYFTFQRANTTILPLENCTIPEGCYFAFVSAAQLDSWPLLRGAVYKAKAAGSRITVSDEDMMWDNVYNYHSVAAKGTAYGTISSSAASAYPTDGVSGSYWYTYQGEDSIDPTKVSYPVSPKGGSEVTVSVTAAKNTYGGTITYQYEVSLDGGSTWSLVSNTAAASVSYTIPKGTETFQARVQARDNTGFTSADWVYGPQVAVVNNSAPGLPGFLTVPPAPRGGAQTAITWLAATDADGNLSGYALERQLDGGDWTVIYTGPNLSYVDVIPKGSATVAYRVRAYDTDGEYGGYRTSYTRSVVNNTAPVITCALSGDLGTKTAGFTVSYTVTDEEGGTVTVTEQVGGLVKRTFDCTLGQTNQYQITGEHFMRIPNGGNVIKITATDEGGLSTVLTLTFTKAVYAAAVMLAQPLEVEEAITLAIMSVLGSIPAGHIYSVEVTNNAKDTSPVWQDVTSEVKNGVNIVFANRVQANGPAFNFRLHAARGTSSLPGYIQSIQGGFQ